MTAAGSWPQVSVGACASCSLQPKAGQSAKHTPQAAWAAAGIHESFEEILNTARVKLRDWLHSIPTL